MVAQAESRASSGDQGVDSPLDIRNSGRINDNTIEWLGQSQSCAFIQIEEQRSDIAARRTDETRPSIVVMGVGIELYVHGPCGLLVDLPGARHDSYRDGMGVTSIRTRARRRRTSPGAQLSRLGV